MAGWHHWLDGRESEWTPGVGDDREAWRAAIHGVTKSQTRLSDWTELNWTSSNVLHILQPKQHVVTDWKQRHKWGSVLISNTNSIYHLINIDISLQKARIFVVLQWYWVWPWDQTGSFPMSGLFTSGGQSMGASASASVLPRNIQGWFPLG